MRTSFTPVVDQASSEPAILLVGFLGLAVVVSKLSGFPPACWVGLAGASFICWQWMLSRYQRGRVGELLRQRASSPAEHRLS